MMDPKDYVLGAGILVTFILGIWNAVANWRSSRRTAFINTVTAERVKWLGTLRENISTFCGLTHTWRFSGLEGKPEEHETLLQIDKLRHLIRLQLNPDGVHDKSIEALVARIPQLTHMTQEPELKEALNELVEVSQKLLKDEWEKVKEESKRGDLKEPEHCLAFMFRLLHARCLKATIRWRETGKP